MKKYAITDIKALEIIDNRGMPTVRVNVNVDHKYWGRADVPCGSSTGSHEAREIRDGDARYRGKGVRKAIQNIHEILRPELRGSAKHTFTRTMIPLRLRRTSTRSR